MSCTAGQYLNVIDATCVPCPHGHVSLEASSSCKPCEPGTAPNPSQDECRPCPKNTFTWIPGSKTCEPCPPGHATPADGSRRCFEAVDVELKSDRLKKEAEELAVQRAGSGVDMGTAIEQVYYELGVRIEG